MTDKTTPEHHAEAILRAAKMAPFDAQTMSSHPKVLSAVREAMEPKWLPITDEVKDGRRIVVSNNRGVFTVEWDSAWSDGWWICPDGKHDDRPLRGDEPTHYQPLPTPPRGDALSELIASTADQYGDTER